jgi:SAM-dependent methyltransferase
MGMKDQSTGFVEQPSVKSSVQSFYDQVGWQQMPDGFYQNATYEDLRPVAREYIHRCHLRILRHLKPRGRLFLDAGSGPIQYPEYLEYSRHYQRRVCVDISEVALHEARKRIGDHGFFVIADIANLPFSAGCFDGVVSLHTIHHLPDDEHIRAYQELYRMLTTGSSAVIVDGWRNPPLMRLFDPMIRLRQRQEKQKHRPGVDPISGEKQVPSSSQQENKPCGTFVRKYNASWLKLEVGRWMPVKIFCWRSISVQFLRALIHPRLGGKLILKIIYLLEEWLPHFWGEVGQYPLIVVSRKDGP